MPTLNWVFENRSIMWGILTQPSSRKHFASKRKGSLKIVAGSYLYIHLYKKRGRDGISAQWALCVKGTDYYIFNISNMNT